MVLLRHALPEQSLSEHQSLLSSLVQAKFVLESFAACADTVVLGNMLLGAKIPSGDAIRIASKYFAMQGIVILFFFSLSLRAAELSRIEERKRKASPGMQKDARLHP